MKVCVLTTSYPRSREDHASVFVHGLCKSLAHRGLDVNVIAPHEKGLSLRDSFDQVHICRFRYLWPASLEQVAYGFGIPDNVRRKLWAKIGLPFFCLAFLFRALRESKDADLLHVHWEISALVGILIAKLRGVPVVFTVHRIVARKRLSRFLTRWLFSRIEMLHFNSTFTASQVFALLGKKPAHEIIYPSIDPTMFNPGISEKSFRKVLGISPDQPVVLGIGRLVEKKGFATLIEAFAKVEASLEAPFKPKLIIAGGGPLMKDLQNLAQAKGLQNCVYFTNFLLPKDILSLLRESTLLVVSSITDSHGEVETLGTVAMEAMACGLPVIASRVGGISDVVEDQKCGILVEPHDSEQLSQAIINLLVKKELREKLARKGLERVNELFTWDRAVSATIASYQQILPG